jgi:trehalose-6-phosphatase
MSKREMESYRRIRKQQDEELQKRLALLQKNKDWETFIAAYEQSDMFECQPDNMSKEAFMLTLWDFFQSWRK